MEDNYYPSYLSRIINPTYSINFSHVGLIHTAFENAGDVADGEALDQRHDAMRSKRMTSVDHVNQKSTG